MKNRIIKVSILSIGLILFYLFILNPFHLKCIFKHLFDIRCPGCGLTRAFKCILNFNFVSALKYNILSIPICILLAIVIFYLFYDILYNAHKTDKFINKILNHYVIFLVLLFISFLFANIRKV